MNILAIDPGSTHSAVCIVDAETLKPVLHEKLPNTDVLESIAHRYGKFNPTECVIERITSYGKPVGREVFHTCEWIGRFTQEIKTRWWYDVKYVTRQDEKLTICHTPRANDPMIRRALIDRFAKHDLKNGKGTKDNPDWFYGFKADEWAAYAVAVTYHDMLEADK